MSLSKSACILSCWHVAFAIAMQTPRSWDPASHDGSMDELWSGQDLPSMSDFLQRFPVPPANGMSMLMRQKLPVEKLHLHGMFDSGTNLLMALLQANIDNQTFQSICPGIGGDGSCWWGKHMTPKEWMSDALPDLVANSSGGAVIAALVRSPLAQLGGWIKAPYGLHDCIRGTDWSHYHKSNCSILDPPPPANATRILQSFTYPTDVWNKHVDLYHGLKDEADRGEIPGVKVLLIEYERLVLDPEAVVREVIFALGLSMDQPFRNMEDPAKHHGKSSSQQEAAEKINKMLHLTVQPMDSRMVRSNLCRHLVSDLLHAHYIPSPTPRSYAAECQGYGLMEGRSAARRRKSSKRQRRAAADSAPTPVGLRKKSKKKRRAVPKVKISSSV